MEAPRFRKMSLAGLWLRGGQNVAVPGLNGTNGGTQRALDCKTTGHVPLAVVEAQFPPL